MSKITSNLENYIQLKQLNPKVAKKYRKNLLKDKSIQVIPIKNFFKKTSTFKNNSCFEKAHKPKNKLGKYVGIEIECYIPKLSFFDLKGSDPYLLESIGNGEMCKKLAKIFDLLKVQGVSVCEDGSLEEDSDRYFGAEIQVLSPVDNLNNLKLVLEILNDLKAFVNTDCGLHVHVDIRNYKTAKSRKQVMNKVEKALPIIGALVKPYRCYGEYSGILNTSPDNDEKDTALLLNNKLKTLEFRIHQGVLNEKEVVSWVNFCYEITHSKELEKILPPEDLEELFSYTKLKKAAQQSLRKKYSQKRKEVLAREISCFDKEDIF